MENPNDHFSSLLRFIDNGVFSYVDIGDTNASMSFDMSYPSNNQYTYFVADYTSFWHAVGGSNYGAPPYTFDVQLGSIIGAPNDIISAPTSARKLANVATTDKLDCIMILPRGGGSNTTDLWRTKDGGVTWNLINTINPSSNNPGPNSLGRWPWADGKDIVFYLDNDGPKYSIDGGTTFTNKVGDWTTSIGEPWSNYNSFSEFYTNIVPLWLSY